MDLCPQSSPPSGAAEALAARAGSVLGLEAAGVSDVPPTAALSRRLGPLALLRAAYLASRIALWASILLIVGTTPVSLAARPCARLVTGRAGSVCRPLTGTGRSGQPHELVTSRQFTGF